MRKEHQTSANSSVFFIVHVVRIAFVKSNLIILKSLRNETQSTIKTALTFGQNILTANEQKAPYLLT